MKWNKTKTLSLAASVVLAGELALLTDAAVVLNGKALSIPAFAAICGGNMSSTRPVAGIISMPFSMAASSARILRKEI